MMHLLRQALTVSGQAFHGPVEAKESCVGRREKTKHTDKQLDSGRGTVGKSAVARVKDWTTNCLSAATVPATTRRPMDTIVRGPAYPKRRAA